MKETRSLTFNNESTEEMVLEGYAAVFNQPTILYKVDGIEYKEMIDRNAFNNADFKDCCLKYNHKDEVPILARTRGNSLKLDVDNNGLKFRANLFNTTTARDVYTLVKAGGLDKCSFAFTIKEGGDSYDRETRTRTIHAIEKVWDCSIVDNPAYESTSVSARSVIDFFDAEAEQERLDKRNNERQRNEYSYSLELERAENAIKY